MWVYVDVSPSISRVRFTLVIKSVAMMSMSIPYTVTEVPVNLVSNQISDPLTSLVSSCHV